MRITFNSLIVKLHLVINYLAENNVQYDIELDEDYINWYIELSDFDGNLLKIKHPNYFKDVHI